jgi:uncharacterized membrane protein
MLSGALFATCLLGFVFKAHCGGVWLGSEQYVTGCYSDVVPFWSGRGVAAGALPYFDARMEYPVLTGALIWIEGGVARLIGGSGAGSMHFLAVATLVNALLALAVLAMFERAGMDRRRLWGWALAPALLLYVGHNWDMLAVTLAIGAMLLARSGRLVAAAGVAGLGVAAKLFPILLLPLIGLQALFGRRAVPGLDELRVATLLSAAAIGVWALVNLPVAAFAYENWSEFYRFSSERSGTAASIWEILATSGWFYTSIATRHLLAALLFVAGAAAIVAIGWRAHRDRLWLLFPAVLAWFMLTNKVYSPQFDLWLYPLLLMVAPRFLPVALFAATGICAYFAEFWWFAGMEGAFPATSRTDIATAAILRGIAMLWLIADMLRLPPPIWITRQEPDGDAEAASSPEPETRPA